MVVRRGIETWPRRERLVVTGAGAVTNMALRFEVPIEIETVGVDDTPASWARRPLLQFPLLPPLVHFLNALIRGGETRGTLIDLGFHRHRAIGRWDGMGWDGGSVLTR